MTDTQAGVAERLTVGALVAGALALAPSATAAPLEPLGHAGRWITDARGRVVVLHGFNTVPVNEATGSAAHPEPPATEAGVLR